MQEARRLELQAQMDAAFARNDVAEIESIRRTIDRETLECTAHTAERLKRVETDVGEIRRGVGEINARLSVSKNRREGAKFVLELLRLLAYTGGGAALLKFLEKSGYFF